MILKLFTTHEITLFTYDVFYCLRKIEKNATEIIIILIIK